jgi:thymidine kinase
MRVLTVDNILDQKIDSVNWTGEMYEAFDHPQAKGVWFIWSPSGNGKSSFVMALARAFADQGMNVFYNSLEEGTRDKEFQKRVQRYKMSEVKTHFKAQVFNLADLIKYLKKRNNTRVCIIDSARYQFKSFEEYETLVKMFPEMIFIITGHGKGSQPKTSMEEDIMFDAYQKIRVDAYAAYCKSRSIGPNGGKYVIWKEKHEEMQGASQK